MFKSSSGQSTRLAPGTPHNQTAQRLTSLQIGDGLIIALHLQLALPQEEVCFHRLPVQLQGTPAVGQGLLMLLHLQVA